MKGDIPGGYCGGVPPLPIPNREVKPACADGTAMQCGRVGGRLLFEYILAGVPEALMLPGRLFSCPWGGKQRGRSTYGCSVHRADVSLRQWKGVIRPAVPAVPEIPEEPEGPGYGWNSLENRLLGEGVIHCIALSGYVTETMWYIVSTLCGGETVIYG